MSKTPVSQRSGATGLLLVFSLTALIVGVGFDLLGGARTHFWIGDQPAAAAALGVAGVLFATLAAHAGRALLGRRPHADKGGADGPHT